MNTQTNTTKYTLTAIAATLVMLMIALMVSPVNAQETNDFTITETEINAAYRVTNPRRATLSNVFVDLQPGQIQITVDHTSRRQETTLITTMHPYIEENRVYWTVDSVVTSDGQQASEELMAQVNTAVATSWGNYVRGRAEGAVSGIVITDTDMTLTTTRDGSRAEEAQAQVEEFTNQVEEGVENGTVNEEDTPWLFRWFQRGN